jgi:hypothetical protein
MARASFRPKQLENALRIARDAGLDVASFEIEPQTGKIVVKTGKVRSDAKDDISNEWDRP